MTEDEIKKEEQPTENVGDGNKPEGSRIIDDTNLAAKRLEEATKAAEAERVKAEENYAKMKLGGGSMAGQQMPEAKKETPEEYHEKFLKGEVNPLKDDGAY